MLSDLRHHSGRLLSVLNPFRDRSRLQGNNERIDVSPAQSEYSGLYNLGNTCYMNSILQSLFHSKPFREALLTTETLSSHDDDDDDDDEEIDVEQQLHALFSLLKDTKEQVSWSPFARILTPFIRRLDIDPGIQEDAEEFLLKVIDKTSTLVRDSIELHVENFISCVNVDDRKIRNEKYIDLSVALDKASSTNGVMNLKCLLTKHFTPELLTTPNQWRSPKYGLQDAEKGLKIKRLPPVLAIHLKRFAYNAMTGDMGKVSSIRWLCGNS